MSQIAEFSRRYHAHKSQNPNDCVAKGIHERLDDLPDPSPESEQVVVSSARDLLTRLDNLDRDELSFEESFDLDLASLSLNADVHDRTYRFNERSRAQQMPRAGDDVGDGIFLMFANDPRPAAERLANITARLGKVPEYVDRLLARIDTPVQRWVAMDIEKVAGLPNLFSTIRGWAEQENWVGSADLAKASASAEAALEHYSQKLATLPTTTQLHMQTADAEKLVRLRGIDKSFSELHQIARDFLVETRKTINELRDKLVVKYGLAGDTTVEALQTYLNKRFRVQIDNGDLQQILGRYERERTKILSFVRERDLFPILEEQDLRILQTPPFMEPSIPAGAMMSPPPFRDGVRTSLIYLTLSEALLDEHTELTIPNMMIHEGIPGHHLQLATASAHTSVIRRHFDAMEHAEGWTTMLEDYMLDMGYMGDLTDEGRFCGKLDLSRIGARVAIDLFFMTGNREYLQLGVECDTTSSDPFVAAGHLLQTITGFTPSRTQVELNWYSQERGYPLCYLTGNRLVWELKADVHAAQAGKLSESEIDRMFHKLYLESGNMPVTYLRRLFKQQGLLN